MRETIVSYLISNDAVQEILTRPSLCSLMPSLMQPHNEDGRTIIVKDF